MFLKATPLKYGAKALTQALFLVAEEAFNFVLWTSSHRAAKLGKGNNAYALVCTQSPHLLPKFTQASLG
jgi:hypothetical protein